MDGFRTVVWNAVLDLNCPQSLATEKTYQSKSCLEHQDDHIRAQRHRGERPLPACICHRHTGPSPSVMVWGAIGYTSRSLLFRIDVTLNSAHYISAVLRPVHLPLIQAIRNSTFQ
ncbi:uncharacterized protein TNCV_79671 [Trichonephila clavipes]|nr:uncharacterized protein TNCV_79671 [Trichonephila clavipes]